MWHSPVIVTPPAAEPVTRDQAKEFLRVDGADDSFDTEIAFQIAGARGHIESLTGTRLIQQVLELRADDFADLALFKVGPIASVDEVSYVDRAGSIQSLPADAYELFGAGLAQGVHPIAGGRWPSGARAITVRATVGYGEDGDAIPEAVRLALLLKVRSLFEDTTADIDYLLVNDRIWL